jgi:hypothetical protein
MAWRRAWGGEVWKGLVMKLTYAFHGAVESSLFRCMVRGNRREMDEATMIDCVLDAPSKTLRVLEGLPNHCLLGYSSL